MTWHVKRLDEPDGTIVIVQEEPSGRLARLFRTGAEEEVGRVARDREGSVNRDRSFQDQLNIVLERARSVAAVKNNWSKP